MVEHTASYSLAWLIKQLSMNQSTKIEDIPNIPINVISCKACQHQSSSGCSWTQISWIVPHPSRHPPCSLLCPTYHKHEIIVIKPPQLQPQSTHHRAQGTKGDEKPYDEQSFARYGTAKVPSTSLHIIWYSEGACHGIYDTDLSQMRLGFPVAPCHRLQR